MAEPTPNHSRPIAEISHGPSGFESFLDRNQKVLIAFGLALALRAGAWVVMQNAKEGSSRAAGEALVSAEDIAAMEDVIKNHPESAAAGSASVLLSDLQWEEGQQTASLDTLRNAIANKPDHPATTPARARLGARLLEQGDTAAAKAAFDEILNSSEASYLAPYALASLAEIARTEGDADKAKSLLQDAQEQYSANPLGSVAGQMIQFVGFEMPTEIDPPEPEPTEPDTTQPDADLPDLSQPVELDPTNPTGSGNPLLDNLTGGDSGDQDTAEDPEPEAPQDPPAGDGEAPADAGETSAPVGGE